MKETYFKILKDLIRIPSPSGNEEELAKYIVKHYNKDGWKSQKDKVHNILFCPVGVDKTEKLPLLYAHLDTSPRNQPPDASLKHEDIIWLNVAGQVAKRDNIDIQMGFDDKAGVAAILYLMKHSNLKFRALLVVQEEKVVATNGIFLPTKYKRKGGAGIEYFIQNDDFSWVFEKSTYVLSLDRANGYDLIDEYGDKGDDERPRRRMCSEKFRDWIIKCSSNVNHKLKVAEGMIADIYNIRFVFPGLDCVNISIGYYHEHSEDEYLEIDETLGAIRVIIKCLEDGLPVD